MMNRGVNMQTISSVDSNSLEARYTADASQPHDSSYFPSTTGPEAASWTMHRVDNHSAENGIPSDSTFQHDQPAEPSTSNVQHGLNATSVASSSTLASASASQDYSSYASYSNATDPYGYTSTGYPGYYNGYQQQLNHSYSQQQPNHAYSQQQPNHGYSQQQPNHAYSQQLPNHAQQQPNHAYSQQQPNHAYSQQQPNHAYTQPLGAYQNTGAPYQPLSTFQNTGSYAGTSSYSATYYNPGDYQTSGAYPSNGYNNQTTLWNDSNYANYTTQQYSNYASDTTSAYSSGTAAATSVNYQQHYKQWADYYNQTEVTCAPGTEHLSVSSTSNQGTSASGVTSGYPNSNSQPPSSFTPSWRPESTSSELPSVQGGAATSGSYDSYWKQGALSFQNHQASPMQPHFQKSLDSKTYDNFQEQQKTVLQGPNSQYPAAHQVPQNYQPPVQTLPSLDTRRVSKLQIPTNPRIASNLALGLSKTDKDGSTTGAAAKPAYIAVSMPKPNDKVLASDPGMFPNSLRFYVERALKRCRDLCKNDPQTKACQAVMKEVITKATADGTLHTRDWDTEPLFPLPNPDFADKESSQFSTPVASLPKYKRSPSKRSKSRWEPLPEEKSAEKSVSVGNNNVKYGGWDRQPVSGHPESKDDAFTSIKFSLPEHKTVTKGAQRPLKKQRLADGFNSAENGDASSDSDKEQSLTAYYSGAIALANSPEEKKKRENRSKRFEKGQGHRSEINYFKPKNAGTANLYGKRASALMLSKTFDDGGSRAVEDIDWDALTVKGTCQEIAKRYLRLTSAPDPSTVRPEDVLEKALLMVQNSQKNYLYKCDQLKSIRQDLTVQRIRNQLTVKVYETHARLALEAGDLPEYNQCQSQLKTLYAEGIEGCHMEFAAYNLLCVILHANNNRDLVSSMSRLTEEAKKDRAIKHALAVRAAVTSGNYVMFFRLYKKAPNLNTCLMDLCVEKIRYKAVSCISRSYRPTVPVSYIAQVLGFSTAGEENDEESLGLEECVDWLKAHGACLVTDSNGEMQLDAKASSSSLYIPEPEDAVSHGDANLAVNDFFTRTSL
ncbi:leukocyte receptor cluster (lrc) member, putative [Ricinus communis]|uniref:Leukocyte receptor cluster (Lrc) member, putative n=1 Tax=Ricinus communis TaxID=3988 RepID=B9SGG2_RICCO|nr:leukocyte receptor cluster (lrc) member, putative [Ricinus communis]